jgi:hypothetical protein
MTTATTRAQLLRAILSARDPWKVLAVATDGIYTMEDLPLGAFTDPPVGSDGPKSWKAHPPPRDTGTGDLAKPLGGWERKAPSEGATFFVAKPGLYFYSDATLGDIRARGVGRREVHAAMTRLVDGFLAWDRRDMDHHVALESRRFYGAKHSIYARSECSRCDTSWPGVPEQGCPGKPSGGRGGKKVPCGMIGTKFETSFLQRGEKEGGKKKGRPTQDNPAYGTWGVREVQIAFDPHPKREREGLTLGGTFASLHLRDLEGRTSAAYRVGSQDATTPEGLVAREAREVQLDQPDWEETLEHIGGDVRGHGQRRFP